MDTLTLPAQLESLEAFQSFVRESAEQAGASPQLLDDIKLWLEEVLTNVFFYAYPDQTGRVQVRFSAQSGWELRIEITDWGIPFDPLIFDTPDLQQDFSERDFGGMGIHLARNLAQRMEYERTRDANHLTGFFLEESRDKTMGVPG
jgi:serine/threonine-protein kinase RsbW